MKAQLQQLTFDRRGLLSRAEFRFREPGMRRETAVTVRWRDVCGEREWFALGWCPPDAWRVILPMLAQVSHCTINAGDDRCPQSPRA
jgi:hypothetical protein